MAKAPGIKAKEGGESGESGEAESKKYLAALKKDSKLGPKTIAAKKKYKCAAEKKAAMEAKKFGAGESGESGEAASGANLCKPKKVKVRWWE